MRQFFGNIPVFNQIDDLLEKTAHALLDMYRGIYIRREHTLELESPYTPVLKTIHYTYLKSGEVGQRVKINLDQVRQIIAKTNAHILDKILKSYFIGGEQSQGPEGPEGPEGPQGPQSTTTMHPERRGRIERS